MMLKLLIPQLQLRQAAVQLRVARVHHQARRVQVLRAHQARSQAQVRFQAVARRVQA